MEVIIVGAGATGLKCASRLRRLSEEAKITVVDEGERISLARCGLPYFISGQIHEVDELRKTTYDVVRDENYFKKTFNIEVLTKTRALDIDRKRRVLRVSKGEKEDELNYDYLVIATGAKPIKIFNSDERILTLFSAEDAEKILKLWENGAEKAAVIGAGFIGLEACEALRSLDLDVTLVEALDQVAPMLDAEIAKLVESHIREKGVKVRLATKVRDIVAKDKLKIVADEEIEADFVVQAVGIKPNVDLAVKAGLEIGTTGAIKVNEFMQTSDARIFAGGDCVENTHILTGKKIYAPFGDVANKHGRVIADNIMGRKVRFPGILGTSIFKVFDLTVAKTGLSEREAISNGFKAYSVLLSAFDKSHYYPRASNLRIKLVVNENSRILGAQIVGYSGVDKRIDVFATAIYAGLSIDEISNLDLAYAPPYAPALDPVIVSANVAMNKREGLLESTRKIEGIILDVRSREEAKKFPVNGALNIPLLELRERVKELPKDAEITIICSIGLRSYVASRILKAMGFKVRVYEGGAAFL
ncbi:MAG: FAD-dependent oxidoreductase [Archaeoglobaceae archaeon]